MSKRNYRIEAYDWGSFVSIVQQIHRTKFVISISAVCASHIRAHFWEDEGLGHHYNAHMVCKHLSSDVGGS